MKKSATFAIVIAIAINVNGQSEGQSHDGSNRTTASDRVQTTSRYSDINIKFQNLNKDAGESRIFRTKALKIFFTAIDDEVRIFRKHGDAREERIFSGKKPPHTQEVELNTFLLPINPEPGTYFFRIEVTNLPNPGRHNPWRIQSKIYLVDANSEASPGEKNFITDITEDSGKSEEALKKSYTFSIVVK